LTAKYTLPLDYGLGYDLRLGLALGSVYFNIRGKTTTGAILPLGKCSWLN